MRTSLLAAPESFDQRLNRTRTTSCPKAVATAMRTSLLAAPKALTSGSMASGSLEAQAA